ncbi:DNA polymerase beta-like protein [Macrophomina phaseolina]|uniref:DNA polymerase n=1 Tax=Macrophomina phaseolina TaxID=35725 RepID=A0ABQ8GN61_9PEZI|nr:DNA polymerase beta-like protein [Macrophomina phaseolina]
MASSSPLSENTPIHSSPPPNVTRALDLSPLPPIFVLPTHLAVGHLHELEERLAELGAQVTYNISEARLVIGKVGTKRRALMELRSRRLYTDDVAPVLAADADAPGPPNKRRKMQEAADKAAAIPDGSTTDDEDTEGSLSTAELRGGTVRVIKMEWLDDSSAAGKLLPLRSYIVYEGKPNQDLASPSTPILPQHTQSPMRQKPRLPSGRSILERAKADAYPGTPSSQTTSGGLSHYTPANRGPRRFGGHAHHTTSRTALLQQTTSDYEGEPSSDMPPAPDWVVRGIKYACQRRAPANPPNAAFIGQLKEIRLTRTLTGDEVGVRAYSTAIAALAAYPYRLSHPKEILRLPGCDTKIANLWIEWKNAGDEATIPAVAAARADETLAILRIFYDIWGVGATTARDFLFDKGWRDLDDVVEYGWTSSLTRVQQIGVKYYDDFRHGIPRREVERIATVIHAHAVRVRDEGATVALVGGYRRGKDAPGDVDLIVSHRDLRATENLVTDLVASLEGEGWITHTLLLSLHNTHRGQSVLPYKAAATAAGPKSVGFDTLDKALVVWQDPEWPGREEDLAQDPKATNPNVHRRVDIIISPWRTVGCAIAGWSGGTTFQRDLRRYAKNVKGWKFDSSGVRDRRTGEVVQLEGPEGVGEGLGWEDAEKKVFEGMGLPWIKPEDRCTG